MGILLPLVILTGLLQSSTVTGQSCKGFKFYEGDREVANVNCTVFTTSKCNKGFSNFPNGLANGSSVGKPRDFQVREFRRNFTIPNAEQEKILTSGALFTWKPALDTTSRRFTKGFYIRLMRVGSGKEKCRLIDLQNVDLTASTNFHFSIEIFPFNVETFETYLTYITSLPPPSDEEIEEGLKEETVFTLQRTIYYGKEPVVYPSKWTTWINLKLHSTKGIVEVSFGYPTNSSEAKFTAFYLQIVIKDDNNPMQQEIIRKIGSETEGHYNFTNVPTGTYKVQVMPKDLFFNQIGKCQCWERNPTLENRQQCSTCKFSATEHFNFTNLAPSIPAEPSTTPNTGSSSTVHGSSSTTQDVGNPGSSLDPGPSNQNAGVVAVAVVIPVVALIMLGVVLFCLYRRGKLTCFKGGKDQNQNYNRNNKPGGKGPNHFVHIIDITGNEKEPQVPQLSRKKVVLLASEDHSYFTQAVERLADFLQVHCMCEVVFAPQQMPQLRKASNSYCWLSSQIDTSDFVIIVTSEAALKLFLAFRKGSGYPKAALGPEGDLFTPGIQHICGKIANNEDVRNIIMVYFEHTSPASRLPIAPLPSFHYHLPNHLTSFLLHIHGLDKTKMDLSQVNLPLQGNVEELEGGQEWLDAVQLAGKYELQNPDWFDLKFGRPVDLHLPQTKPDYNKQDSEDSGYNEMRNSQALKHRLSSASDNAGGMADEADGGLDNASFSKDDFFAPSICTAFTAYTVPFPSDNKPPEIDDMSISEEFHRLNQQYEQELQQCQSHGGDRAVCDAPANHAMYPGGFINIAQDDEDQDCLSVSSAQSV